MSSTSLDEAVIHPDTLRALKKGKAPSIVMNPTSYINHPSIAAGFSLATDILHFSAPELSERCSISSKAASAALVAVASLAVPPSLTAQQLLHQPWQSVFSKDRYVNGFT